MAGPDEIVTPGGRIAVLHRLALAVEAVDAVNRRPAAGVRVGRETGRRSVFADPALVGMPSAGNGRGRLVLRHDRPLPGAIRIRLDDPARRWVPRRLDVSVWTYDEVRAADADPPGAKVPPEDRLIRPWLRPGVGYPCPPGATGLRFGVRRGPERVAWPRLEVFDAGGFPVGWAHGDGRGEVLVLIRPGAPATGDFPIVVRVHAPDPDWRDRPPAPAKDPLRLLHPEPVARAPGPADPAVRGDLPPPGYLPPTDHLLTCTVGRVKAAIDLAIA
ncbi:hypothetical protein GCM10009557_30930 [Virgisporangium ochraceum]|uniref:Uncharacterized protein n=1 Tax=Virgisporangium ochraceum TaxID=65505 RepID=A0A8J4EHK6_9ACTN|nr:hypothetical protein [Virgisporangium ochraceum]GIJ75084.1 hypothetical protein Voc01_100010 [Virgisporangium ochraceum]